MMSTPPSRLIPLTDDRGRPLLSGDDLFEPEPGSVVLVNGQFGQAWQRRFDDRLWHSTGGGRGRTWERMLQHRNLVLVYDAIERAPAPPRVDGSDLDLPCIRCGYRYESEERLAHHERTAHPGLVKTAGGVWQQ